MPCGILLEISAVSVDIKRGARSGGLKRGAWSRHTEIMMHNRCQGKITPRKTFIGEFSVVSSPMKSWLAAISLANWLGIRQCGEPVRIEAFCLEGPSERFHECIIGWLARSEVYAVDPQWDPSTGPGSIGWGETIRRDVRLPDAPSFTACTALIPLSDRFAPRCICQFPNPRGSAARRFADIRTPLSSARFSGCSSETPLVCCTIG
jgi:hypothetical protein